MSEISTMADLQESMATLRREVFLKMERCKLLEQDLDLHRQALKLALGRRVTRLLLDSGSSVAVCVPPRFVEKIAPPVLMTLQHACNELDLEAEHAA